jgi:hypothetical protein
MFGLVCEISLVAYLLLYLMFLDVYMGFSIFLLAMHFPLVLFFQITTDVACIFIDAMSLLVFFLNFFFLLQSTSLLIEFFGFDIDIGVYWEGFVLGF